MSKQRVPRVYLAGPDVFYKNADARARNLKELCALNTLEGVFPLDTKLNLDGMGKYKQGKAIFKANVQLIDSCDAVLANMTPFRGPSMDIGTGWEMGYASGKGKPVVGYTDSGRHYADRAMQFTLERGEVDLAMVEDFDMTDNLMVHCGARIVLQSPERAIEFLAELLSGEESPTP